MTNNSTPSTNFARSNFLKAVPHVAYRRGAKVLCRGFKLGVFVVFAMYVANLIVLPLLTKGRVEDFIDSPYRALQKLLVAFGISMAIAIFQAGTLMRTEYSSSAESENRQ